MNIGFGITGSFCTHQKILEVIKNLIDNGHNVLPILTAPSTWLFSHSALTRLSDISHIFAISLTDKYITTPNKSKKQFSKAIIYRYRNSFKRFCGIVLKYFGY